MEIKGQNGYVAQVSKSNRLLTSSAQYDILAKASADSSESYLMYSGNMVLPSAADVTPLNAGTTNQGYAVHWFKNSSPDKNLVIHSASWGSDGGSNPAKSQVFFCKPIFASPSMPPTSNLSSLFEIAPKRQNLTNPSPPDIEAYAWDNVGSGLVMPAGSYSPVEKIMNFIVQRGYQDTSFESAFIMPPGSPAILHIFDAPSLLTTETLNCHITIKAFHAPIQNPWLEL